MTGLLSLKRYRTGFRAAKEQIGLGPKRGRCVGKRSGGDWIDPALRPRSGQSCFPHHHSSQSESNCRHSILPSGHVNRNFSFSQIGANRSLGHKHLLPAQNPAQAIGGHELPQDKANLPAATRAMFPVAPAGSLSGLHGLALVNHLRSCLHLFGVVVNLFSGHILDPLELMEAEAVPARPCIARDAGIRDESSRTRIWAGGSE